MRTLISPFILLLLVFSCGSSEKTPPDTKTYAEVQVIIANDEAFYGESDNKDSTDEVKRFLRYLNSDVFIRRTIKALGKKANEKNVTHHRDILFIKKHDNTNMVGIKFYDNEKEYALRFLDTLLSIIFKEELKDKVGPTVKKIAYIRKQLGMLDIELRAMEDSMQNEKVRILPDFDGLDKLEIEYGELRIQRTILKDLSGVIAGKIIEEAKIPPTVYLSEDPFLKESVKKLIELSAKREGELYKHTKDSKEIKDIDKDINELKDNLKTYNKNTDLALSAKMADLDVKLQNKAKEVTSNPNKNRINLERRFSIKEKQYTLLLEKLTELSISTAGYVPSSRIIEGPVTHFNKKQY